MNDARRRRIQLKKRIEEQRKKERSKGKKALNKIVKKFYAPCQHGFHCASIMCPTCNKKFLRRQEQWLSQPAIMEENLRASFGLGRTVQAKIFVSPPAPYYEMKLVDVTLPINKATEKIMAMKKNGFWAHDSGYPVWFPPERILEVVILN